MQCQNKDQRPPGYRDLLENGELARRVEQARELLKACRLCPRCCGVDRTCGETGVCGVTDEAMVTSYGPHFGEEAVLVGTGGSGTIFFTGCNLKCIFCQNFEISWEMQGSYITLHELAAAMLSLQSRGCHNINLVTPTHQVPQILAALLIAAENGLMLPIVYNSGGYDSVETLRILDRVIDIYMPDMKYSDNEVGRRLSGIPDYWDRNREAVKEMHRQVGDLVIEQGIAVRGLLVRHLVLPGGLAGTPEVVRFLAEEVSRDTYINIMAQYRPMFRASREPQVDRRITSSEYEDAVNVARAAGLWRFAE